MKKLFLAFFLTITVFTLQAQEQQEKKQRLQFKDLPGAFVFDIGATRYRFNPDSMDLRFFASKGMNLAYTYDIKLAGNFSFSPGVGVSINNYAFKNAITIADSLNTDQIIIKNISSNYKELKKTKLNATYVDIPLEFRWRSNPDVNSFKIVVGAKVGMLVSSHTKIAYKDDGKKVLKQKEDYSLERFRYGAYARVGYGIFHLYGYYSLTELFQEGKAPNGRSIVPFTIGISLSAF